jgi:AAA domain
MPIWPVQLRSSLVLVAGSGKLQSQLDDLAAREGFPQSPYEIEDDLNFLTAAGGVPVTLDDPLPGKTDWSVLVHTRRYMIRLFLTGKYEDAYSIASISPLRLRDHQRLAEGYLLARPRRWRVVSSVREIPQGADPGWGALTSGWDALAASMATAAPPTEEESSFLGTLGEVIDAAERITTAAESGTAYPYKEANPTGGARSGATQSYEFTLAGSAVPDDGAFVQVATRDSTGTGTARARGQVTRASGMQVTIRFDEPVDWNDLRGQGEISTTTSTVVYRMQREALRQLRTGRARNPGILQALVAGEARLPVPARGHRNAQEAAPEPAFELNRHQREAFDKALTSPDILTVIGPPGTGKTTTITEIVRAVAGRRERVIVCSQNNRAVDNVLGRLPRELLAIRVGNAARIAEEGLPHLLQRRASELRAQTLNKSRRKLTAYEQLDDAKSWAGELADGTAALTQARVTQAQALYQLDSARREAGGPAAEELDRCAAVHAEAGQAVGRSEARARRLRQLSDRVAPWSAWMLIGRLFALLATRWYEKSEAERVHSGTLAEALRADAVALNAAQLHLIDVTKDVPAVAGAKRAADDAMTRANQAHATALRAARSAIQTIEAADVTPPAVRDDEDTDLAALQTWLSEWLPRLAARQELLTEWVSEAAGDASQLHTELLRYADVLASTCTGAGSRPELADLDFDLAIVDESGQIGVADALVPLVRAKRAILVGDHMQLPPYLDSEVDAWGQLAGDPVVKSILSKSALELLIDVLPPNSPNVAWLTEQRRMPEVIANFASMQFYEGRLETPPGLREHRDDLFRSPLAFIDTSALEWAKRRDQPGGDKERLNQRGYRNQLEAELLADLAVHYARTHQEWGVIVPYLAQAELVRKMLAGRAGGAEVIRLNVGTVDSFQGGERDVILYGFTRSNPERRVGFLSELRRVNVAMSRAKMQLVMVGDMETLTSARNAGFRDLARSMRDYVEGSGEIVPYSVARGRLRTGGMV